MCLGRLGKEHLFDGPQLWLTAGINKGRTNILVIQTLFDGSDFLSLFSLSFFFSAS